MACNYRLRSASVLGHAIESASCYQCFLHSIYSFLLCTDYIARTCLSAALLLLLGANDVANAFGTSVGMRCDIHTLNMHGMSQQQWGHASAMTSSSSMRAQGSSSEL
jgi:hypothetical protein